MTHTSYEVSKRLKEFCPELPRPMSQSYSYDRNGNKTYPKHLRYQLHDILSKPFCEAVADSITHGAIGKMKNSNGGCWIGIELHNAYYNGGLPAVEAELMKMMGGK